LFPRATEATAVESYYGIRLDGITAADWEKSGMIDVPAASLPRDFFAVPELELDKPFTRAFRREGNGVTQLRPSLRPPGDVRVAGHDLVWHLGSHATVEGTVRWARETPLALAEFHVPESVKVTDVRAADLAGWFRTESRIKVWFRNPSREASVRWFGELGGYSAAVNNQLSDPPTVDLPLPAVVDNGTTVRVRPADGWAARVQPPAVGTTHDRHEILITANPDGSPLRVLMYPPVCDLPVTVWQVAEPDNVGVRWRAVVQVGRQPNRPLNLSLRVSNLPAGAEVIATAGNQQPLTANKLGPNAAEFSLTTEQLPLVTIQARLPVKGEFELPILDALFAGILAEQIDRWLAVPDTQLQPTSLLGLRQANYVAWPNSLQVRSAAAWRLDGDNPVRFVVADLTDAIHRPSILTTPTSADKSLTSDNNMNFESPDVSHWLMATGWFIGFGLVGLIAAWGPRMLWPEYLMLLGVVGAVVAGGPFLMVVAAGGLVRVIRFTRAIVGWAMIR
jgi:hypothetical protein